MMPEAKNELCRGSCGGSDEQDAALSLQETAEMLRQKKYFADEKASCPPRPHAPLLAERPCPHPRSHP